MKTARIVSGLATVVVGATLTVNAFAFQIFRPNPVGQTPPPYPPGVPTDYIINAPPTALPPFVHWDLREMPGCAIPWSYVFPVPDIDRNGTPDQAADRAAMQNTLSAAWTSWANVNPAVVDFVLGDFGAAVGGRRGIALDGYNVTSFVGPAHDDQQCVALNAQAPAPGGVAANRPFAPVVAPGPDGLLATIPPPAPNDDQVSICIASGPNNNSNTAAAADVQVIPVGNVATAGAIIVNPGPDAVITSGPQGDDVIVGNTIREPAVGGNGRADTPADDDVQIVANGAAAGGCSVVVTPGPNGSLESVPGGDDIVSVCILAGPNGNCNTTALSDGLVFPGRAQDDVQSIPVGNAAAANATVVAAGPDGVLTTAPRGDDVVVGNTIREPAAGGNGRADTDANNQGTNAGNHGILGSLGLTGIFFNNKTGVLIEADVELNSSIAWSLNAHNAAPPAGTFDLQQVTMHEYGHCLGIAHPVDGRNTDDVQTIAVGNAAAANAIVVSPGPDGQLITQPQGDDVVVGNTIREPAGGNGIADTPRNNAANNDPPPANIMNPFVTGGPTRCNQLLSPDDASACNFLYSPDLGDAKDTYQVKIRNAAGTGRNLSGVPLASVRTGATHVLGTMTPSGLGNGHRARFEWLGADEDGNAVECEPRQVNQDAFDDGLVVPGNVLYNGAVNRVKVLVSHTNQAGRYVNGAFPQMLYMNGYFDFNNDVSFGVPDLEIWWQGVPGVTNSASANFVPGASNLAANPMELVFDLNVPNTVAQDTIWTRIRLDYGEDEGRRANISGDLAPAVGASQFGEVEDYAICNVRKLASVLCPSASEVPPGNTVQLQFCFTNIGPDFRTFNYSLSDPNGWIVSANPGTVGAQPLNPGDSYCIDVTVQAPPGCTEGQSDTLCWVVLPNAGPAPQVRLMQIASARIPGLPIPAGGFEAGDTCCAVVRCTQPTATELATLVATPGAGAVTLEFGVADESDLSAFQVYRGTGSDAVGARVNAEPIRAEGLARYRYVDESVAPGTAYWYRIGLIDRSGRETLAGRIDVRTLAAQFALGRPYPNPTKSGFSVRLSMPRDGRANVRVVDVSGRVVTTLQNGMLTAGDHTIAWNGTANGRRVASGLYFVIYEAAGRKATQRVVLAP